MKKLTIIEFLAENHPDHRLMVQTAVKFEYDRNKPTLLRGNENLQRKFYVTGFKFAAQVDLY